MTWKARLFAGLLSLTAVAMQLDPDYETAFAVLERGEHYAIYDAGVETYPATTFLVQSSKTPINLGAAMQPLMDTTRLWEFIKANDVPVKPNSPAEVYLYNWANTESGAQGPMVFDVGVVVEDDVGDVGHGEFVVKRYPVMKFASLIYVGPFPHETGNGWHRIRWAERAREKGYVYTERLYRELYHRYDYDSAARRHVTEIQIEIE